MACNLHFAALELRLSTVSAENAGSFFALQGMTSSSFIQTSLNQFSWIRIFWDLNVEVHKFDNPISDQCYLSTRRYFFNQSDFLRYFTHHCCCHDHSQVQLELKSLSFIQMIRRNES